MATLGADELTLLELANRTDDGNIALIAEVLLEQNEYLQDAIFLPANKMTGHQWTERLALPTTGTRRINDGVAKQASKTRQNIEDLNLYETHSQVDRELVTTSPNPSATRAQEDSAFVQSMANQVASDFIYGNRANDPTKLHGLAARMSALDAPRIIGAGGSGGDTTSIFVVQWGADAAYFFFNPNFPAGLEMNDKGEHLVDGETAGTRYFALITQFVQRLGLAVIDPARNIARVANIESTGSSNIFDEDLLIKSTNELRIPGNASILVNRTVRAQMQIRSKDKTNVNYTSGDINKLSGQPQLFFNGIPIRLMDAIVDTETAVA
jgi:hypothetical protein